MTCQTSRNHLRKRANKYSRHCQSAITLRVQKQRRTIFFFTCIFVWRFGIWWKCLQDHKFGLQPTPKVWQNNKVSYHNSKYDGIHIETDWIKRIAKNNWKSSAEKQIRVVLVVSIHRMCVRACVWVRVISTEKRVTNSHLGRKIGHRHSDTVGVLFCRLSAHFGHLIDFNWFRWNCWNARPLQNIIQLHSIEVIV